VLFLNNNLQQPGAFPNKECASFFQILRILSVPVEEEQNRIKNLSALISGFVPMYQISLLKR
jgi:hypothetical protein